jgi:hypothetical protein
LTGESDAEKTPPAAKERSPLPPDRKEALGKRQFELLGAAFFVDETLELFGRDPEPVGPHRTDSLFRAPRTATRSPTVQRRQNRRTTRTTRTPNPSGTLFMRNG